MCMDICDFYIEHYDSYFFEKNKFEMKSQGFRRNGMIDYIFSNDFFRNIDAMIYTCGYESCAPGHSYGPILRNGYLIHYVLSGIYKTRGKLFRLKQGDAFLICPDELIYYEADIHSPWAYTWIGMQGIKIKRYLQRTSFLENLVVHYGEDQQLKLCHEKMAEADKLPKNRDLIMNSILYEYLFLLACKFPNEQYCVNEKKSNYVEEALQFIEEHYCDPITVQDVANHLNINRSYLHRIFKSFTNVSIQNYLLDYRMRQACILLKDTEMPIYLISRSVSYVDPLYFSRLFHQKMGIAPSDYRKKNQKKEF